MDKTNLADTTSSPYHGQCIALTTKHQKGIALAQPFMNILGAEMFEYVIDTDRFGTFSGEVERQGSAYEVAKRKCREIIKRTTSKFFLASEGSFAPHPNFPMLPSDHEILYFIDKKHGFEIYESELFTETNYRMSEVQSIDELVQFAEQALFPTHALVISAYPKSSQTYIFKGIETNADLEWAFHEARKQSPHGIVWVETDMRAHYNPTRMRMLSKLGEKLANRLNCLCPSCRTPGWGMVSVQRGLPCELCRTPTQQVKAEVYGCAKCDYQQAIKPEQGMPNASPQYCFNCNP